MFFKEKIITNYEMKLIIPSINLEKNIYKLDSGLNNVDYNIEILEKSDIDKKLFYLAGHSGRGDNCFFNRVRELKIGDYVYIINDDNMLVYAINDSYYIVKNGYMEVNCYEEGLLYLITCDIYNSNRQLIVKGVLIN